MTNSNAIPNHLNARIEAALAKHAGAKNQFESELCKAELNKLRDELALYAGDATAQAVFKAAKPIGVKQFMGN